MGRPWWCSATDGALDVTEHDPIFFSIGVIGPISAITLEFGSDIDCDGPKFLRYGRYLLLFRTEKVAKRCTALVGRPWWCSATDGAPDVTEHDPHFSSIGVIGLISAITLEFGSGIDCDGPKFLRYGRYLLLFHTEKGRSKTHKIATKTSGFRHGICRGRD